MPNETIYLYNEKDEIVKRTPCNSGDWTKPLRTAFNDDSMVFKSVVKLVFRGITWVKGPDDLLITDFTEVKPFEKKSKTDSLPNVPEVIEVPVAQDKIGTILNLEKVPAFELFQHDYDGINGHSIAIYQNESNAIYDKSDDQKIYSLNNVYTDGTNIFKVTEIGKFKDLDTTKYEQQRFDAILKRMGTKADVDFFYNKMQQKS